MLEVRSEKYEMSHYMTMSYVVLTPHSSLLTGPGPLTAGQPRPTVPLSAQLYLDCQPGRTFTTTALCISLPGWF